MATVVTISCDWCGAVEERGDTFLPGGWYGYDPSSESNARMTVCTACVWAVRKAEREASIAAKRALQARLPASVSRESEGE